MPLTKCEFCNQRVPANKLKLHQKRCVRYRKQLKKEQLTNLEALPQEINEQPQSEENENTDPVQSEIADSLQTETTEPETKEEVIPDIVSEVEPEAIQEKNIQVTEPETKEKKKFKFRGR